MEFPFCADILSVIEGIIYSLRNQFYDEEKTSIKRAMHDKMIDHNLRLMVLAAALGLLHPPRLARWLGVDVR